MILENELRLKLLSIVSRPARHKIHPAVLTPREDEPFRNDEIFEKESSRHLLELGSGWGEFALQWLAVHPDDELLALEVKADRIRHTLKMMEKNQINHLKVLHLNFNWFLEEFLPPNCFDWIIINFPDPWPKRRHWKHRLVQSGFPDRMALLLRPSGTLHLATDYSPYARRMLSVMRKSTLYDPVFQNPDYRRERPEGFPPTRFERRQRARGFQPYFMQWKLRP